jgi:uncharacterized coiled-coil DUF342 family protein
LKALKPSGIAKSPLNDFQAMGGFIANPVRLLKRIKNMESDNLAKQLHDKFTRGKPLSSEEQTLLEEWYTHHDDIENNILVNYYDKTRVENLQNKVNTALSQLMTVTKRVQEIAAENETLKREIHELRGHWVQMACFTS